MRIISARLARKGDERRGARVGGENVIAGVDRDGDQVPRHVAPIHLDQSAPQKAGHMLELDGQAAVVAGRFVTSPIRQQRTLQGHDRLADVEAAGLGRADRAQVAAAANEAMLEAISNSGGEPIGPVAARGCDRPSGRGVDDVDRFGRPIAGIGIVTLTPSHRTWSGPPSETSDQWSDADVSGTVAWMSRSFSSRLALAIEIMRLSKPMAGSSRGRNEITGWKPLMPRMVSRRPETRNGFSETARRPLYLSSMVLPSLASATAASSVAYDVVVPPSVIEISGTATAAGFCRRLDRVVLRLKRRLHFLRRLGAQRRGSGTTGGTND